MTELIETITAGPSAHGHYSPATAYNGLVFVSGQLPTPAADGAQLTFADEVRSVLEGTLAILHGAGSGPGRLLKVTAYIVGAHNWPEFNRVYAEVMGAATPARAVVPVPELHLGWHVEVDAIAACGPGEGGAQ